MARIERRVQDLADEDSDLEHAIETVLDRSEDGDIEWSDVSDELTSGQWGRLIETGIVVEGEDGLTVADPSAIRSGLENDADSDGTTALTDADEDSPDVSWSTWDKIAGLFALFLFPGYYIGAVRNTVGSLLDLVLGPVDSVLPFYAVIMLLAVLTGLYSTLLQANLMDPDKVAYYQKRMQAIQEREQAAKEQGDEDAVEEVREEQAEAMAENLGMFKEQFRPMPWTMILVIPVFLWMYWKLLGGHVIAEESVIVLPLVGQIGLLDGVVGPMPAWIVWYFLCSLGFSQIIRKALDIQTTPDTDDVDLDGGPMPSD